MLSVRMSELEMMVEDGKTKEADNDGKQRRCQDYETR